MEMEIKGSSFKTNPISLSELLKECHQGIMVVVVLPTPPFWLATARICALMFLLLSDGLMAEF